MTTEFPPSSSDIPFSGIPTDGTGGADHAQTQKTAGSPANLPQPVDAEVKSYAAEKFQGISESARLAHVARMDIPAGVPSPLAAKGHDIRPLKADPFRFIAKEGAFQKWVEAISKATQQEIQLEREDLRLRAYRDALKDKFRDFLRDLEENKRETPPAA